MKMVQPGFASRKKIKTYLVKIFNESLVAPVSKSYVKKEEAIKAFVGAVSSALTLTSSINKVILIEEKGNEFTYLSRFEKENNNANSNQN